MRANIHQQVHFLSGNQSHGLPSLKEASSKGIRKAATMGLIRVAGNMFECPSTKDLWKVSGDKVIRLSNTEVDNEENLKPANEDDPKGFLASILAELEF